MKRTFSWLASIRWLQWRRLTPAKLQELLADLEVGSAANAKAALEAYQSVAEAIG